MLTDFAGALHPYLARLVVADVQTDQATQKEMSRKIRKSRKALLTKSQSSPRKKKPKKAARKEAAILRTTKRAQEVLPQVMAQVKTPPLSIYSPDPIEREVAFALRENQALRDTPDTAAGQAYSAKIQKSLQAHTEAQRRIREIGPALAAPDGTGTTWAVPHFASHYEAMEP